MNPFVLKLRAAATAGISAVAIASCTTPPTQAYSPTAADQAVLIHFNNKWAPIFDKVDLASGRSSPEHEGVRTEGIPEKFDYTAKRVTPEIEQRLGLRGGKSGRIDTGYGVTVWEPGDYAMIGVLQFYVTGPGGYNANAWCFVGQAPVLHIEAGALNIFEPQNEMQARIDAGASYDPAMIKRQEDRIRFVLEEFPVLKGPVKLAPVVASVQYYKPRVPNPDAMCDHDDRFIVGPPKPLPPPPTPPAK